MIRSRDAARKYARAASARADLIRHPQSAEVEAATAVPLSTKCFDPQGRGRRLKVLLAFVYHDYGSPRRGLSYETTAFRDPLYQLGCEVIEARLDVLKRRFGSDGTARVLLELAFRHDVDVVFVVPFKDEIAPRALGEIRSLLRVPVFVWFCDDHWRFDDFTAHFLPHISVAITTSASALSRYHALSFDKVIRSQWSVNHRIFRPLSLPRIHDLSFFGQPHSDRREFVKALRSAGLSVATRGLGWPEGRASLLEVVQLSNQSHLCLNFSNASRGQQNQVKGRDFEIPAMGRPLLTADSSEIAECFSSDEVVTYSTVDELVEVAKDLLHNDSRRESIAQAGYARVLRDHTAEKRLGDLFSKCAQEGWLAG